MPGYTPLNDNFVYEVFMREKENGSMNEDRYGDSCIKQPSIRLTIKVKFIYVVVILSHPFQTTFGIQKI